MSFVRVGGKNAVPRKKKTLKMKPWDDTLNDLDAYKATPDEIAYRRAAHRSKHAVSAHLTRPGSAKKGKRSSPFRNNSHARKIAIMKEVLYDQRQLQDVLEKSDTMMAVVKDLFGDDPRRFEGFPSVTSAPNSRKADVASSLVALPPEMRTRSEELSDSMMNASALNQLQDDSDLDDSHPAPLNYQPKINMQRFQQFLEAEEKNTTLSTINGQAGLSHLGQLNGAIQSSHLPDTTGNTFRDASLRTPPKAKKNADESLDILKPPKSAMNDTGKINKTKKRVPKPEPVLNTSNLTLNELRKVLETLEDEIADFEQITGRRPPAERNRQETFSGYTLAIVDSVTKLTRYLRDCELQLRAEVMVREQLTEDVVQFRALVDALTSDIISTQEEFHKMSFEFQKFRLQTQEEMKRLKGGQTGDVTSLAQSVSSQPGDPQQTVTPPRHNPQHSNTAPSQQQAPAQQNGVPMAFGDHLKAMPAAVMLSPPVRRSRVTDPDREAAMSNRPQQGSLLDVQDYVSGEPSTNNSALHDDYADLPGSGPTSLAPLLNQFPEPSNRATLAKQPQPINQQPKSQAPASINSISVPKPTPLVQSNVGFSLETGASFSGTQSFPQQQNQPFTVVLQDRPQTFQRSNAQPVITTDQFKTSVRSNDQVSDQLQASARSHDSQGSQGSGPDREFLASQIAALNKQHGEAQKRLQHLMIQQQSMKDGAENQQHQQQHVQQRQQHQQQQETVKSQQRQQVVDNQQRIQQQQLQFEQQQKLIEMVVQQQQKIQQQQLEKQQQQMQQQQMMMKQQQAMVRPNIPGQAGDGSEDLRKSAEYPGYRPLHKVSTGLPEYPVSPNISPISDKSYSYRNEYQSVDSEPGMAPSGRGITVSLPTVDMDQSDECTYPPMSAR
ncbi:spindle and centriole-associated protein 1-like [Mya arenaria]|uniref:spindle and centriole-associated protein 1-like n=1 Tax=Mya arenaria TaxID=6604 RepID=UPI0022E6E5DA|nr:spindle and centriole-associated protein 1-like [Mya arenaria]XP_052774478.1 spindle and centriole-associated protein 1-like [Mya arenaria]